MAQQVKDMAVITAVVWVGSLPRNFCMMLVWPKNRKKPKKTNNNKKECSSKVRQPGLNLPIPPLTSSGLFSFSTRAVGMLAPSTSGGGGGGGLVGEFQKLTNLQHEEERLAWCIAGTI